MREISSRFIGYNKKQVDIYLEKLLKTKEDEIFAISESIELYNQEIKFLNEELNVLHKEKEKQNRSSDFFDFAFERAQKNIEFIDCIADDDIKAIVSELKQRKAAYDDNLAVIEKEVKNTKSKIDWTLQNVISLLREKGDTRENEEDLTVRKVVGTILSSTSKTESIISALGSDLIKANDNIVGKVVINSNGSLVGRVGNLVINEPTKAIKGFYIKGSLIAGNKFVSAEYIMAIKNETLVVSPDWQKASFQQGKDDAERVSTERLESLESLIREQVTADGTVMTGRAEDYSAGNLKLSTSQLETGLNDMTALKSEESPAALERASEKCSEGFWDFGEDSISCDIPGTGKQLFFGSEVSCSAERQVESKEERLAIPLEDVLTEPLVANKDCQSVPEDSFLPLSEASEPKPDGKGINFIETEKSSLAVSKDIKAVRHKYVLGKLAGEDLLDSKEQVIIRKGGLITALVVERAEREGKLAELIVHMVIPGLDE